LPPEDFPQDFSPYSSCEMIPFEHVHVGDPFGALKAALANSQFLLGKQNASYDVPFDVPFDMPFPGVSHLDCSQLDWIGAD